MSKPYRNVGEGSRPREQPGRGGGRGEGGVCGGCLERGIARKHRWPEMGSACSGDHGGHGSHPKKLQGSLSHVA